MKSSYSKMGESNTLMTLVMIHHNSHLLLGMKKRGFGAGKWTGFGGKVEPGETIEEGAKRELLEESCVKVQSLDHIGRIDYEFVGKPKILEVHVFKTAQFEGEPTETEEMRPQWFELDAIPFKSMWLDAVQWYPLMLKGSKFKGYFRYEGDDKILDYTLNELDPNAVIESSHS